MLPAAHRILKGPTDADRGAAADMIFFAFVGALAVLGLQMVEGLVFDLMLIASVVGFLSTMSLARLITRGQR
ncbi:pesticidal protein Cry26Aa [Rhodococcus sp. HNM0569]|nr:monovalent cation/H+ antiporter complex subunit F [Rhodococcus sp. HNM0569]NLU83517.1 pesticidal protein Cry26Aa [Rhodococcus sp. HNM0569]